MDKGKNTKKIASKKKVVVLIDNNPDPGIELLTGHGISIYFEADGLIFFTAVQPFILIENSSFYI